MSYFKKIFSRNKLLLIVGDTIIIICSFYLSILFRFDFSIPAYLIKLLNFQNLLLIILIKLFWFNIFSLYRGMWRYTSVWDMFNIIKANFSSTICLIVTAYYFIGFESISRSLFVIDFIFTTGVVCVSRLGIRMFFSHIKSFLVSKSSKNIKKRILLIGAGDTGQTILRQTLQKYIRPVEVVAFLDDNPKKIGRELHGVPVIGAVNSILNINVLYDEIYICVPSANRHELRAIVEECKKTNKPFKTLPSISELIESKVFLSQFREVSLVDLLGRKEVTLDKSSINKFIKGKRVLVTGAGGSIGSELVRQCIKFEPSVLVLMDISELNLFEIDREIMSEDSVILFKPILSDIRDYSVVDQVFNEFKPQVVFHAAAYKHVPMQENFPWEAIKTNVYGTSNVSDLSIKYNVDKFVLVSTDKAVKPANVMGATKRLAEIIIQNYNNINNHTDFMAVRFGNVLGSSGSVIPIFQEQIKKGGPITITDPEMERYFMSIPEASQLILQAGSLGLGGEVFILDMGAPIKIIDIANDLIRLSGYEPELDISIRFTGTRPGEKKIEELSLPNEELDKTKHDKIFVLNNLDINEKEVSEVILGIEKLKIGLSGKTPNQVRSMLSSILPEYKPDVSSEEPVYLKLKAEA
jgi:FlaA1/EpsC-like NDP-sugar epimerase